MGKNRRKSMCGYVVTATAIAFSIKLICFAALANEITIEQNPAVINAIKKTFETGFPKIFQTLPGGFSSPGVYKISVNGFSYALRLSHPKRLYADQQRTITSMRLSDKRGLAPKIFYANAQDGIFITEFIESKYLSPNEIAKKKILRNLALTIRKLHDGPSFPEFLSIYSVRKKFEQSLKDYKSHVIGIVSSELSKIEAILTKNAISKPTHNDLKPENILFDGKKFWLIDWEAACQGDPYFDIATIITFYALGPREESLFLTAYFGKAPTRFQNLKLYLMKQVVMGYYGTAYLMVSKSKHTPRLLDSEIEKLPKLQDYLQNKLSKKLLSESYQDLQKFGWVLLKEVFVNVQSVKFKEINLELESQSSCV